MLNLFLELIDRAINLTERKNKRTIASIVKLVDPIFKELRNIHQNYLDVFGNALDKMENCNSNVNEKINEIIKELKKDRLQLLSIRDEIQTLAKQLKESKFNDEIIDFFNAVHSYFPTKDLDFGKPPKYKSAVTGLIGYILRAASNKRGKRVNGKYTVINVSDGYISKEVCNFINKYIEIKSNQWKIVCEKYAEVKRLEAEISV